MRNIRTARLKLRPWRANDQQPLAEMIGDPHVRRFFFRTRDRAESDAWMARIQQHWAEHDFGLYVVELPGHAEFIGFVGLMHVGPEMPMAPAVEIAWTLAQPWWGRGFAPEAARAVLEDGFARLHLPEIVALTAEQNQPSRVVMEKLGMRHDPAATFIHPMAPEGHELARHVLYRMANPHAPARGAAADAV